MFIDSTLTKTSIYSAQITLASPNIAILDAILPHRSRVLDSRLFGLPPHLLDYPLGDAQALELLASVPALIEKRFCVLSGRQYPLSDPVMTSVLQLLGIGSGGQQTNGIFRLQSLRNVSCHPLSLVDLASRLDVIARAWPKYDIVAANCELFSRSICFLALGHNFCFASRGYMQLPNHVDKHQTATLRDLTTVYVIRIMVRSGMIVILLLTIVAYLVLRKQLDRLRKVNSMLPPVIGICTFGFLILAMGLVFLYRLFPVTPKMERAALNFDSCVQQELGAPTSPPQLMGK